MPTYFVSCFIIVIILYYCFDQAYQRQWEIGVGGRFWWAVKKKCFIAPWNGARRRAFVREGEQMKCAQK